jgi:hypothetical protein
MAITINVLRRDWMATMEAYDRMISYLDSGHQIHPIDQDSALATREWLQKLRHWRTELNSLLNKFPEQKDA